MQERTRAFIAFEIPDDVKGKIGSFCDAMRSHPAGADLKWVRADSLHMTVRFFGDLDRKQLDRARAAVRDLAGQWVAPDLSLGQVGAFPSARRPQVVWLGVEDAAGHLRALADLADRTIRIAGFGPADKPFVGHLTLARVRRGARPADLEELTRGLTPPSGPLTIRSITLFKSDLRPEGPIYTPLEAAAPGAGPGRGE